MNLRSVTVSRELSRLLVIFQAFADGTNYFLKMELECTSVCAAPLSPASTCRRSVSKDVMIAYLDPTQFRCGKEIGLIRSESHPVLIDNIFMQRPL